MVARLLSVNVGLPRDIAWQGKTVRTAVWKTTVAGPRRVRRLNIDGDGQGDLSGHGGEHRAVFVYQIDSYRFWRAELDRDDFEYGQFGENFTVDGLPDDEVCIGDQYRVGDALLEVTQPRVTCYRVGIRLNDPRMPARLVESGRPGFYLRVLTEGEVEAGSEIVRIRIGPEQMTVSEINALLYLPGRSRGRLERALRIPALSRGWRESFQAMLAEEKAAEAGPAPLSAIASGWTGFRKVRVADKRRESASVTSLTLKTLDRLPLVVALPGQFIVLRFSLTAGAATQLRSYSLSGEPSDERYRISVKREPSGLASVFLNDEVQTGDVFEISAPRGDFTLRLGERPIVLLSAGVGATPVLAMLHVLAAEPTQREIWWLHGAHNGREHAFAAEVRNLLKLAPRSRSYICYSSPGPDDKQGADFDAYGRLDMATLQALGTPLEADFYLCGPSAFMAELAAGLNASGVVAGRIHAETFGPGSSINPGVVISSRRAPHPPAAGPGAGPQVSFARSGVNVRWTDNYLSLLELAEACDVPTKWACRAGVCHTCETGLVAGQATYRPEPMIPPADGALLLCCARPRSDIVLDL